MNSQLLLFVELICDRISSQKLEQRDRGWKASRQSDVIAERVIGPLCSVLGSDSTAPLTFGPRPPGSIRKVPFPGPQLRTANRCVRPLIHQTPE